MFMSVVSEVPGKAVYGELAGARVLVTGLTAATGVDVTRAFADHKARLVVQAGDASPEITELGAVLAETAADIKLFNDPFTSADQAIRFTQNAVQIYGGLDTVINLVTISSAELSGRESETDIETLVSAKLLAPTLITRVVANRMRLTWTEGSILNIVVMPQTRNPHEAAFAGVVRTALAAVTRGEAQEWAQHAVRINAIGPRAMGDAANGACLTSEPDIAALALYLASKKGRQLSGHVFDAEGVAGRGC